MEIRRAVAGDIPELCMLLNQLFEQEEEFKPNEEVQAKGLKMIIDSHGTGDILVTVDNTGRIRGMVNLLYTISTALGSKVAILEDMVIDKNFRSKGVGTALIKNAVSVCTAKGCSRITLLTDESNRSAQKFYVKNGFSLSEMKTMRLLL